MLLFLLLFCFSSGTFTLFVAVVFVLVFIAVITVAVSVGNFSSQSTYQKTYHTNMWRLYVVIVVMYCVLYSVRNIISPVSLECPRHPLFLVLLLLFLKLFDIETLQLKEIWWVAGWQNVSHLKIQLFSYLDGPAFSHFFFLFFPCVCIPCITVHKQAEIGGPLAATVETDLEFVQAEGCDEGFSGEVQYWWYKYMYVHLYINILFILRHESCYFSTAVLCTTSIINCHNPWSQRYLLW